MAFNPSHLITPCYIIKLHIYFVTDVARFLPSHFISYFIAEIQGQGSPYILTEAQAQSGNLGVHIQSHIAAGNDISIPNPVLDAVSSLSKEGKSPREEKGRAQHTLLRLPHFPA